MSIGKDSAFMEIKSVGSAATGAVSSIYSVGGLNKLELFAALMLQGLLANGKKISTETVTDALKASDLLVVELDKRGGA